MKKKKIFSYLIVTMIMVFIEISFASQEMTVEALANLPEDQINIGLAALILAKEVYPETDIQMYSEKLIKWQLK